MILAPEIECKAQVYAFVQTNTIVKTQLFNARVVCQLVRLAVALTVVSPALQAATEVDQFVLAMMSIMKILPMWLVRNAMQGVLLALGSTIHHVRDVSVNTI